MMIPAANGLARILQAEGVPWVSTFPVCIVNNALGQEGLPLIMARDERYAVALADAYSRVTGGRSIGVCTVMGGINPAGLQMAYGALAQAYEDSSPLLCLADGVPAGAGGVSRFDLAAAFSSVTKWIGQIDAAERVPEVMRRAYTALRTGRPGPVLVTVPRGLGDYDPDLHPYAPVPHWRPAPDPADVAAAVAALRRAARPLIYAGEGVRYAGAAAELLAFAEATGIPVLTTLRPRASFPRTTRSPWACAASRPWRPCAAATPSWLWAPASRWAISATPSRMRRPRSSSRPPSTLPT
jgi:acetolactate synthase-1/2/3 large subunit